MSCAYYGSACAPYGSLALTVSSPSQSWTEPLTDAEVKAYLGLPAREFPDDEEDAMIAGFIAAARNQAEILQGRDIVRKQWDLSLDYFNDYQIRLRAPLVSVDLVKYRDSDGNYTTLTENTDYVVDTAKHPGVIVPAVNATWPSFSPWPSSAVLIRFTSGFASADPWWLDDGFRVKAGMKMLISSWYENRLPFEVGANAAQEYPYSVTALLSYGALVRVR